MQKALNSSSILPSCFLILLLLIISGCVKPTLPLWEKSVENAGEEPVEKAAEDKVVSVEAAANDFLRDEKGIPTALKLVAKVKLQGSPGTELDYACRLTYADQFVNDGVTKKEKLDDKGVAESSVTILAQASGKLDFGKWNFCCDLGQSLTTKTAKTLCGK